MSERARERVTVALKLMCVYVRVLLCGAITTGVDKCIFLVMCFRQSVMDVKKAVANMWDGRKQWYTAHYPTMNTSVVTEKCHLPD